MNVDKRKLINKLIVEVSKSNEEALEQLFDITKNELYRLIMEYINDRETRERVLSFIFLKVVRRAKRFDSHNSDGFDWMCEIAKELSLKFQKKQEKTNYKCNEVK